MSVTTTERSVAAGAEQALQLAHLIRADSAVSGASTTGVPEERIGLRNRSWLPASSEPRMSRVATAGDGERARLRDEAARHTGAGWGW
jgi:hypothetical protein